jgi:hypothetical protein
MNRYLTCAAWVALVSALAGCASTPKPVLDEANNGAALAAALSAQIERYREEQARVLAFRIDSIRRLRQQIAIYEVDSSFDQRVLAAAGSTRNAQLYATLVELSDSRAADEKERAAQASAIDDAMKQLTAPLPSVSKELKATQDALAKLGEELSAQERVKITAGFAQSVYKTVRDNRDKIKAAEDATPTATAAPTASAASNQ